ncbi:MAG TPA: 2-C-methyl-D-erythritol 2,4-cyclodiphosphate synthase [Acidobacteriota bacterium]|nr:2-C-methyl-D-erythritol 2,4-cyclodiphosphate synthase [Acidobacteriota bacterium]
MELKTGIGYDIHRLAAGRKLVLGGVRIPSPVGLAGHSDADALVHALIDALLGASGDGDIGRLFPDTDPTWKDADSTVLLKAVMARLRKAGLELLNADAVIVAEKPAIAPYVAAMKRVLCPILGIKPEALGIKGKTNEGLGPVGQRKAIVCLATVLLRQKPRKRPA